MKKVIFHFENHELSDLSFRSLQNLRDSYVHLLEEYKFPPPPADGNYLEMIPYLKRKDIGNPFRIGCYENITIFEAANRIASDLVILNGLIQLVQKDPTLENARFTVRLGTTHVRRKGDFTIVCEGESFEGEAFNVAPTFLATKLRNTIKKWDKPEHRGKLKYILINDEAFEFRKKAKIDKRVFRVRNWGSAIVSN